MITYVYLSMIIYVCINYNTAFNMNFYKQHLELATRCLANYHDRNLDALICIEGTKIAHNNDKQLICCNNCHIKYHVRCCMTNPQLYQNHKDKFFVCGMCNGFNNIHTMTRTNYFRNIESIGTTNIKKAINKFATEIKFSDM